MPAPLVTDFLRYRKRFRVGPSRLTPISSEAYPKLTGWPPNINHDTDLYQSIIPFLEGQNADGYVFSLTGERLSSSLAVAAGHSHELAKTALAWWPVGSWQCPANRGPDKPEAAVITTSAYLNPIMAIILGTLQPGTTRVAVRACVTGPFNAGAANFFQLKFSLYGDLDTSFLSPITTQLVWDLSVTSTQKWLETSPIDISGLSFSANRQLVCLVTWSFDVAAGAPDVAVYQIQIGALDQ